LQLANPNLKWERTAQTDVGVDVGLLADRITVNGNLYDKKTTNLLLSLPIPAVSGYPFRQFARESGDLDD